MDNAIVAEAISQPTNSKPEQIFGAIPAKLDSANSVSNHESFLINTAWRVGGQILRLILQVATLAYLARVLTPEDFGVVAYSMAYISFGQLFLTAGPSAAIIQVQELRQSDIDVASFQNIAIGLVATFVLTGLAPLASTDEHVTSVVRMLSASFFIGAIGITSSALLQRNLRFPTLVIADMISFLTGNLFTVAILAHFGWGAFSLAAGNLVAVATKSIWMWTCYPVRLLPTRLSFGRNRLARFSVVSSLSELMFFITTLSDVLLTGRIFGSTILGHYSRAQYLVRTPANALLLPLHQVLFSTFARQQQDHMSVSHAYCRSMCLLTAFLSPAVVCAVYAAKSIVHLLLGPQWYETAPLFALMAPLMLTGCSTIGDAALKAIGALRLQLIIRLLLVIATLGSLYFIAGFGTHAIATTITLLNTALFIAVHVGVSVMLGIKSRSQLETFAPSLLAAFTALLFIAGANQGFNLGHESLLARVVVAALAVPFSLAVTLFLPARYLRLFQTDVKQLLRKATKPLHYGSSLSTFN